METTLDADMPPRTANARLPLSDIQPRTASLVGDLMPTISTVGTARLETSRREAAVPGNEELSLDRLVEYPDLARAHAVWREKVQRNGDARLDPSDLPRHLLRTVMVIEVQPDFRDARVRLAGTRICEIHGRELRDETVRHFFKPGDAEVILASMRATIDAFNPSLARRACVSISGDRWDFVRLLLPERDGQNGHRLFEVIDRATLTRLPGPW